MTLGTRQIDLEISDDTWSAIDAYASELGVSSERALDELLGEMLDAVKPVEAAVLMCDGCGQFRPHNFIGTKPSGLTAREQLYRCTCGTQRRYGLVA